MKTQKYVRRNNGWGAQLVRGKRGEYFQGATELKEADTCCGISSSTFNIFAS